MIHEQLQSLAVPMSSIQMDPHNARLRTPKNLEALKSSLTKYGQRKAIVVHRETNTILAGNGTYQAAKEMGWEELAAIFVDDDEKKAMGYAIADNRTGELAEWDEDELLTQLTEIGESEDLGFDDNDLRILEEHTSGEASDPMKIIFPEYDESVAQEVEYHACPKCQHKWPK